MASVDIALTIRSALPQPQKGNYGINRGQRHSGWPQFFVMFSRPYPAILILQHIPADDDAHDLIRALEDLVHSQVTDDTLDTIVGEIAIAAMDL